MEQAAAKWAIGRLWRVLRNLRRRNVPGQLGHSQSSRAYFPPPHSAIPVRRQTRLIRMQPRLVLLREFDPEEVRACGRAPIQVWSARAERNTLADVLDCSMLRPSSPKSAFVVTSCGPVDVAETADRADDSEIAELKRSGQVLKVTLHDNEDLLHLRRSLRHRSKGSECTLVVCTPEDPLLDDAQLSVYRLNREFVPGAEPNTALFLPITSDPRGQLPRSQLESRLLTDDMFVLMDVSGSPASEASAAEEDAAASGDTASGLRQPAHGDTLPFGAAAMSNASSALPTAPNPEASPSRKKRRRLVDPRRSRFMRYVAWLFILGSTALFSWLSRSLLSDIDLLRQSADSAASIAIIVLVALVVLGPLCISVYVLLHGIVINVVGYLRHERRLLKKRSVDTLWQATSTQCVLDGEIIKNRVTRAQVKEMVSTASAP